MAMKIAASPVSCARLSEIILLKFHVRISGFFTFILMQDALTIHASLAKLAYFTGNNIVKVAGKHEFSLPCVAKANALLLLLLLLLLFVQLQRRTLHVDSCGDLLQCCSRGDGVNMRCNAIYFYVGSGRDGVSTSCNIADCVSTSSYVVHWVWSSRVAVNSTCNVLHCVRAGGDDTLYT